MWDYNNCNGLVNADTGDWLGEEKAEINKMVMVQM